LTDGWKLSDKLKALGIQTELAKIIKNNGEAPKSDDENSGVSGAQKEIVDE